MKKKEGFDFRKVLKSKPRNLPVQECQSKLSPQCLLNFIEVEEGQTMCKKCKYHSIL